MTTSERLRKLAEQLRKEARDVAPTVKPAAAMPNPQTFRSVAPPAGINQSGSKNRVGVDSPSSHGGSTA